MNDLQCSITARLTLYRLIGILFNNQQYSIKNVKFNNCATGIAVQHAFVITLQGIECNNVGICVDMGQEDVSGSMSLLDSSCDVRSTGLYIACVGQIINQRA